ncbi:MAG TPA: asparagine synthase (glutamine-hydrolyzing) [Vicinamibacterales bacterium]|nr:asparagine synthase (glutamine-hydrolyzing) [Vicinamibacterales bacterium]
MCGIAGILFSASHDLELYQKRIERMTATLHHRGPDACGTWIDPGIALGHTRLSIIDLSDAGRQPIRDDSGRYTMVYNGEVYNFEALRRELESRGCRFRSHTDSEVVLYAYREWGPQALQRFNGMWAFAIWDAQRHELFAARDRAGKKPLYYSKANDGSFLFASEIKAFLALGVRYDIDTQAAFDFLSQGTYGHLGSRGFLSGVSQLPAAHYFTVTDGRVSEAQRYWDLPVVPERDRLPYDAAFRTRFRDLAEDAVRLRLRADVPVGATLSGGLDSSAIVGIAEQLRNGDPLHIFTSQFPGSQHDETRYFDAVAERLFQPIIHRVRPPSDSWREHLLDVLDHQEEPFGDTSILAHFHLMRAARDAGVPVILSGQGGDELLFGYPSMVNAYLGHLVASGHPLAMLREARDWSLGSRTGKRRVLTAALGHSLPLGLRDRVRSRYVASLAAATSTALQERSGYRRYTRDARRDSLDDYVTQVFTRFAIPHLVHYDDRNAMAFSVEGRMPFLDHRLVELMWHAPYEAAVHRGVTKRVLRDTFADVIPSVVIERRDKVGFHTPLARWLREDCRWVDSVMTAERIAAVGASDAHHYRAQRDALVAGDDTAAVPVWRALIFHLWAERFGVRAIAA